jgi:hypothetical protein
LNLTGLKRGHILKKEIIYSHRQANSSKSDLH